MICLWLYWSVIAACTDYNRVLWWQYIGAQIRRISYGGVLISVCYTGISARLQSYQKFALLLTFPNRHIICATWGNIVPDNKTTGYFSGRWILFSPTMSRPPSAHLLQRFHLWRHHFWSTFRSRDSHSRAVSQTGGSSSTPETQQALLKPCRGGGGKILPFSSPQKPPPKKIHSCCGGSVCLSLSVTHSRKTQGCLYLGSRRSWSCLCYVSEILSSACPPCILPGGRPARLTWCGQSLKSCGRLSYIRLFNRPVSYFHYLWGCLCPHCLSVLYF